MQSVSPPFAAEVVGAAGWSMACSVVPRKRVSQSEIEAMTATETAENAARSSKPTVRPFGLPRLRDLQASARPVEKQEFLRACALYLLGSHAVAARWRQA